MHLILHFFHFSREKSLKILLASFLKVLAPLHQLQNTFLVQAYKVLTKQSLLLLCFGGEGDAFLQFSCDDAYSVFNLSGHETTLVIVGHTVVQSSLVQNTQYQCLKITEKCLILQHTLEYLITVLKARSKGVIPFTR